MLDSKYNTFVRNHRSLCLSLFAFPVSQPAAVLNSVTGKTPEKSKSTAKQTSAGGHEVSEQDVSSWYNA